MFHVFRCFSAVFQFDTGGWGLYIRSIQARFTQIALFNARGGISDGLISAIKTKVSSRRTPGKLPENEKRENHMARKINKPSIVEAAGTLPKKIAEIVGLVNTGTSEVSIARMTSPQDWVEPGQRPEFTEYTVVLNGSLRLELADGEIEVSAGEAVIVEKDEWVRYSTPNEGGADYISVCLPAFSPDTVHRDED